MGSQAKIDEFASRQHGVFNTAQCLAAGFDRNAVKRRRDSGAWLRLGPTVYALPSAPPVWERRVAAAVLSRPAAYVAGPTAAYLQEFPGVKQGRPVIVVPEKSNARSDLARVIRHRRFQEIDTLRVAGFEVTSAEETVVMLGREYPEDRLTNIVDDLLVKRHLDLANVQRILVREAESRVRGLTVIQQIVEERLPTAPSIDGTYLERLLESLLRSAGITDWVREFPFSIRGRPSRVDFYFERSGLVLEADGRAWHARLLDFETDRRRDNELTRRGIRVLRFTYRMLTNDHQWCISTVKELLDTNTRV